MAGRRLRISLLSIAAAVTVAASAAARTLTITRVNVGRIRAVVVAGRFLDRKDLDGLLQQVKTAAGQ